MPQPTQYNRQGSFTGLAAQNPGLPYTGVDLDAEFNSVKITLDEVLANIALIQRDDGDLANGVVGVDQLEPALLTGLNPAEPWLTSQEYETVDTVTQSNILYVCAVDHTSGVFATDLAASKWSQLADFNSLPDGSVLTAKLADASVTTVKIADLNVTTGKVAASAVTYAKIQNVSATSKVLGRVTTGAGVIEEIDCTAAGRALIDDADATAQRTTLGLGSFALLSALAIDSLSDVNAPSPTSGQAIVWSGTEWVNSTVAGSGAPLDADYLVRTANATLSAERVVTDTATVAWDWATGGQAKAGVVASSIGATQLATDAVVTAKIQDGAVTAAKLAGGILSALDPGTMVATARIKLPSGFLWCTGAAISRATYSALLAAISVTITADRTSGSTALASVSEDLRNLGLIGAKIEGTGIPAGATITALTATTITLSASATSGTSTSTSLLILPWGAGDGSTTFNTPDKRGRAGAGRDDMGAAGDAAASRLSALVLGTRLGNAGGTQTHTLIEAELAAHDHTATTAITVAGSGAHTHSGTTASDGSHNHGGTTGNENSHNHSYTRYNSLTSVGGGGAETNIWKGTDGQNTGTQSSHSHTIGTESAHTHTFSIGSSGTHTHTATGTVTVNNAGSDNAHNNVQPTIIENWIIKT